MNAATLRTLCEAEYDFVRLITAMGELAERLDRCPDCPRAKVAARQLRTVRRLTNGVLTGLDREVTDAVEAATRLDPAPS